MTTLILVRHCQAEGNEKRFFQGRIDTDITSLGALQIEAVGRRLQSEPIERIYVSSLRRAVKTAEGINQYHHVPMITDDRLIEIDAGLWEGRYLTDIAGSFPEEYENWNHHPERFAAPQGESMAQVYDRVGEALREIAGQNDGKTVCLVSHGCAIKNMMCFLRGLPVEEIGQVPLGTNTSVNMVSWEKGCAPKLLLQNDAAHLAAVPGNVVDIWAQQEQK